MKKTTKDNEILDYLSSIIVVKPKNRKLKEDKSGLSLYIREDNDKPFLLTKRWKYDESK